ncbi:MAG TPA: outer membrane protein assembly factor BamD [Candidatus Acidoferrum sp.]|nr:outer membrane protein assembly factor BamD [Candidatus Acidoferrum sp.]
MACFVLGALFLLGATTSNAQIFHRKKKVNKSTSVDNNAQPDKILYDKAMDDIKHGRQEVGRLSMQTLINTYPDSEYLAKAKLAIADSYYKEGGTSNLALAVSGYKDFEVFFPFLPEATYAQMQVAMAHYRQMEKPDRDRSHAIAAEEEFQIFLQKYPNDPLAPQAQQHLREVQEVLAEGEYRIGYYYYVKGDKRAAAARLLSVTERYPLYSRSDRALWMLGDILEKSEHKEVAAVYYGRIVKNYPLSSMATEAKDKLKSFGAPIPQPDPAAVAWMTAEQNAPRPHTSLFMKPLGMIKSGPTSELFSAARSGAPNLQPEAETASATDILTGGGQSKIGGATTGIVATVSPGGTSTGGTTAGSENVAAPATDPATNAPATSDPPKDAGTAPAASSTGAASEAADGTEAKPDPAAAAVDPAPGSDTAKTGDAAKSGDPKDSKEKDKKESSSKKKKGLRKIVPW